MPHIRRSKKNNDKPKHRHSIRLTPKQIEKKKQRVEERKKNLEKQLKENIPELNYKK